eukprot:Skav234721  [mRNA]  locus=scaffold634:416566:420593:- [translate_table: standard]
MVPWSFDVNDHWDSIRTHLQQQCRARFPLRKRKKRQLYFGSTAWNILCTRKEVKPIVRSLRTQLGAMLRQGALRWWHVSVRHKRCQPCSVDFSWCDFRLAVDLLRHELAMQLEVLDSLDLRFRSQRRADWKAWVSEQLDNKVRATCHVSGSEIFHILKPKQAIAAKTGALRRPLVGLRDAEGRWCSTPVDTAQAWQTHFGGIEHAEATCMDSLLDSSVPHCRKLCPGDLRFVPTLYQLEQAVRGLQLSKAPGADGLGAELLRNDPQLAARRLYPLLLKSCVRCQGVVELTGGWLLPLFKGRGSPHEVSSFRAILLEPTVSRAFSRSLRPSLLTAFDSVAFPLQFGGSRGFTIQSMHLQVRLWQATAKAERISCAILFVDIRSAFYGVVRQMLSSALTSEDSLQGLFQKLRLPVSSWLAFRDNVLSGHLLREASGSSLLAQGVESALQHSWFSVPAGTTLMRPLTGSRPGDPNADLLFAFIMTRMLEQIQERLLGDDLIPEPLQGTEYHSNCATWADDLSFLVTAPALELMAKLEATASHVVDVLAEHGFGLSCGPGKTAALVEFSGKGSVAARQDMEAQYQGKLRLFSEHIGALPIPLVNKYKHLGGHAVRGGSPLTDIKVRSAMALEKMRPLRRILHHPILVDSHRQLLLRSCGLSVLTVHAGTWAGLDCQTYQTWQAAVTRLYSTLHPRAPDGSYPQLSLYRLALDACAPMPMELLYVCRLRLFFQLLASNDLCLRSAVLRNWEVLGPLSWLAAVQHSVDWLAAQVGLRALPPALFQVQHVAAWDELQSQTHAPDDVLDDAATFPCPSCEAVFSTQTGLAVHQRHVHDVRAAARRFAVDGVCRICRRCFHTRPRLLAHWCAPGNRCWITVFRRFEPLSSEAALSLDNADCQRKVAAHQHGLPPPDLDLAWRWASLDELSHGLPVRSCEAVGDVDPQELSLWKTWGSLPPGHDERTRSTRKAPLPRVPKVHHDLQRLEALRFDQAANWVVPSGLVPRPLANNARYVLIFFSGHRREDDISAWLYRLGDVQPLAIDTAVDEHVGNVFDAGLWVSLIRSGKVLAGHGAPPCETFSDARWVPCEDSDFAAPQPLRDAEAPWGVPFRSVAEVRQCLMGNLLMYRTVYLLALIHLFGGAITMEHPKGSPPGDIRWGIWRSSLVRMLTQDHAISTTAFLQGPLGRDFAKPTVLLHGRLPFLPRLLFGAYQKNWSPSRTLIGRVHGQWATCEAKAYPSRLCRVLAEAYLMYAAQVTCDHDAVDPPGLQEIVKILGQVWDPYLIGHTGGIMKSDYQPHLYDSLGAHSK